MRIYLAGTTVSRPEEALEIQGLFTKGYKLHSYYHCNNEKGFEHGWFKMNTKNKVNLFLDSGGFSAWTQNEVIDIKAYGDFIKEHDGVIEVYANLDAIGDPVATWKNQKTLEKMGLKPLPVFHYAEDVKWLLRYLNGGYEYICLGGMVPISTPALVQWLDSLFSDYLCDSKGLPKVKVHGFGLTALRLMLRYPWFSVDSTSWVMTARMGSVYIPRFAKGRYIYDEESWKVAVSSRSPAKKEAGKHLYSLPPTQQETILSYFESKGFSLGRSEFRFEDAAYKLKENERWVGKELENGTREVEVIVERGLCNDYRLRDELNIIYFLDLEESIPKWPWPFKKKGSRGFGL